MNFLDGMDLTDKQQVLSDIMQLDENKKAMFMYVCALAEAGAAYVELDFESLVRLPKPSGAENYIYRIGAPEEYVVANALNFSYATVPLKYHRILPKLELPAILEVETGDSDVLALLQLISSNINLSEFGMLRLVGEFDPDSLPGIVSTYRRRSVIPLDICPTNNALTALSSAIAAYRGGSDAVTVSFGDYESFASLEELLIMLSAMYKTVVSPDYLEGICRASLFSALFSEQKTSNLSMMMRKYMFRPMMIERIDAEFNPEEAELRKLRPPLFRKDRQERSNPASRLLDSMGIDPEMSANIIKILDSCSLEISEIAEILDKDKDLQ